VMVVRASRAGLGITAGDHRHIDGKRRLAIGQRVARQRRTQLLRVHATFAERGVHAAVPPLVRGNQAEVRQAVHCPTTAGSVDHLEQRIAATPEASINGGTERPQLTQPDGVAHD
jgi:hypothetical protein